ncbi:MAG: hypothetical protein IJ690_07635 [Clostridia bacterium]|nr:hypothetical protein [Clostridia bacterium]MBR1654777.1 hypothetical protein [Clostridia bacterium]
MFNNPYVNSYNAYGQQNFSERIDNQIAQLQQMKEQMKNNQQQPAINQTFQLAPNHTGIRYANTVDEVNKEIVYSDTPFFSKDMSVLWVKDVKGSIKTYELNEIVPKDEKDIKIEFLMAQIDELKKGMKANESYANVSKPITNTNEGEESSNVPDVSKPAKKSK